MNTDRYLDVKRDSLFGYSVISSLKPHNASAYDRVSYEQLLDAIQRDLDSCWEGREIVLRSTSTRSGQTSLTPQELKTLQGDLARAREDLRFVLENADV